MQQLLLNLDTGNAPSLDNYLTGQNGEVIHLLKEVANRHSRDHFVYLWGENATGKTHLLKALSQCSSARYITANNPESDFFYSPDCDLYLLDDCERLTPEKQIAAFNLFNQVRENNGYMITSGPCTPLALDLRDDLKSRLCWGLVYQIKSLTDEEKITALNEQAKQRGFTLSPGVLPYLITHYQRDMHSLSMILDALDRYSLQTKRTITLPLLHDLLEQKQEPSA